MNRKQENELDRLEALKAALAARALSVAPCGDGDHRLATYVTPAGQLMCIARVGALVSEVIITEAVCGTDQGCQGMWHCLSSDQIQINP